MSLDRFELLELRREGGIQTYHAREIATARPVQVHFFAQGNTSETASLLGMLARLPEDERRRVIDRGESRGLPYIVTDRLAGYADVREWITANATRAPASAAFRPPSVDEQFLALFDTPVVPGPAAYSAAAAEGPSSMGPTAAMPAFSDAPQPQPAPPRGELRNEPSLLSKSIEIEALQPRRGFLPTAAKSLLWLVLGIIAALAFLAAVGAFFAFRPR